MLQVHKFRSSTRVLAGSNRMLLRTISDKNVAKEAPVTGRETEPKTQTKLTAKPTLDVGIYGQELLNNSLLNKGSAFTEHERHLFKLHGLLPPFVSTLESQVDRAYNQFKMYPTDLLKNQFCQSLKDQNKVLYYALVKKHLKEILRIIYTPTAGDAIAGYSQLFRRPEGCFLDINYPERIQRDLEKFGDSEDIDYIVVSDSEAILGIGDQGVGGIGISVAKLGLMTACGGIHPARTIPVVLDCGTDNEERLNSPLYMGSKHRRIRGQQYDDFIDTFVRAVKKQFPKAVLHFEDFGVTNASRLLEKYRPQLACFNDDIQGTGAVTLSALKGALHATNRNLEDVKILIYGAGSAGTGIANQIVDNLVSKGIEISQARSKILLVDRPGLLTTDIAADLSPAQKPFATNPEPFKDIDRNSLYDIVKTYRPDVLVGTSTRAGAFTKEIVLEMASHVERPIIFPLSNPTRLHEAFPEDLIKWTNGKVLCATGSPFEPVDGREISENNNFFIFPGIGLGAVLSRAKIISNGMIAAAVDQLASLAPVLNDPNGALLPATEDINDISARVATAVVVQAVKEGSSTIQDETSTVTGEKVVVPDNMEDCYKWVKSQMWHPEYMRYRRAIGVHR